MAALCMAMCWLWIAKASELEVEVVFLEDLGLGAFFVLMMALDLGAALGLALETGFLGADLAEDLAFWVIVSFLGADGVKPAFEETCGVG